MARSLARRTLGALSLAAAPLAAPAAAAALTPAHDARPAAGTPVPPYGPPLVGVVRDTAGTPLPNVQVMVAGLNRVVTTDDKGAFVFRGLPAGRYHVDAMLIGYARADADVVIPQSGADVRLEIVMRPTALRLSNVVVSASPVGADPLRVTQSTVDLSGKELNRSVGASVAQTLSGEPGLAVRFNGPAATTPVVRGLTGDRVLVLQDGDRAGDLSSSASDHGLSIDPLSAQRMEVVRGPASLLYGTNALGGVVNVISDDIPTEVPTRADGYVATQAESVNPGAAGAAGLTLPLGRSLAITARGGVRRADDLYQGGRVRLNNSFNRTQNGVLGLGYVGEGLRVGLAYRAYGFEYGLPVPPGDDEVAHIQGGRQELRGRADLGLNAGPFRYLRAEGSAQWYDHDEVESDGAIGTSFDLRTQTLNLTSKTRLGRVEGAVGAQGLFRQYAATGEEALTPSANTRNGALFVYQELPLGGETDSAEHGADEHASGVRLQLGARFDAFGIHSLDSGDPKFGPGRSRTFDNVSGSVGLSIPLARRVTLGVSAARAFRAPTVEELFSNAFHAAAGTYDVGNPELKAEINQGIDGVLRAQRGRVDAQLSAYYNHIADFVTPNIVGAVDPETGEPATGANAVPLNEYAQRDARLYGAEGRAELAIGHGLVLGALGDVVRGEFTAGGALPFMPPARLGGLARWDNGRWSLGGELRHAFAQTRTSQSACGTAGDDGSDAEPGTGVPCVDLATPAYTLLNLNAGYTLYRGQQLHSIVLRADNLLDESYYDAASRIKYFARNPGRNVSLVYRVQF